MIEGGRWSWRRRSGARYGAEGACSVLFVCTANVCRSPMAEALLRHRLEASGLLDRIAVDSCGTRVSPLRRRIDPRAAKVLGERGVGVPGHRARPLRKADFSIADWVLCMDRDNLEAASALCPPFARDRLGLLMAQVPGDLPREVPDPYFGDLEGFRRVADLLSQAIEEVLRMLRHRLEDSSSAVRGR